MCACSGLEGDMMTLESHREPCRQSHGGPEAEELPLEPCSPSWAPTSPLVHSPRSFLREGAPQKGETIAKPWSPEPEAGVAL